MAFYAGLRLGEERALPPENVVVADNIIRVRWSHDQEGTVEPKSKAGNRDVPIIGLLRPFLEEQMKRATGLFFPGERGPSFAPSGLYKRARRAWQEQNLTGVTLQDARHTAASIWIASGVHAKAISKYMGHESITTTYDIYGHLFPDDINEHARMVDEFLATR